VYRARGKLEQVQAGDVIFNMPVDITLKCVRWDTTFVLQADERLETFELLVDARPLRIEVDEDDWILKDLKKVPLAVHPESRTVPDRFTLAQNYPNPFNPGTSVRFHLPETSEVEVMVFNPLGQRVRLLHSGVLEAGDRRMQWDGRDDSGAEAAAGVYLLRVTSGGQARTIKMVKLP
jgi:hypothetical protein